MKFVNVGIAIIGTGLLFGACSNSTISPNWGLAYQEMRAKQVLDQTAGEKLDPVEGQDGKINATAMEAYRKGFEKPESDFEKSVVSSGVRTK